jgi:uncharacterized protein with PQ loop repeat
MPATNKKRCAQLHLMANPLHHIHKRKEAGSTLEPFPHPDKWKNALDRMVFMFAMFSAVMTIPQLFQVWVAGNSSGVSPLSWGAYTVTAMFWTLYGMVHREPMIISVNVLFTVLNALVFIGAVTH